MKHWFNLLHPQTLSVDQAESRAIAATLKSATSLTAQAASQAIGPTLEFETHQQPGMPVDVRALGTFINTGSRFDIAQHSARQLLRRTIAQQTFKAADHDFWIMVNPAGEVHRAINVPTSPAPSLKLEALDRATFASQKGNIELIAKAAALAGGVISSSNVVPLVNWLQFHQLNVPKTVGDIQNLIALLTLELPTPPLHGNYWGDVHQAGEPTLFIDEEQHSILHQHTYGLTKMRNTSAREPLISYLSRALYEKRTSTFLREYPQESWALLLELPFIKQIAQSYIEALGLDASSAETDLPVELYSRVLVSAIIEDLDLGTHDKNTDFRRTLLYARANAQANVYQVREGIKDWLSGVDEAALPLAIELILAGLAPEFLVDAPVSVTIGSLEWVTLRRSVMLTESIAPGLSRNMSYAQLMELGAIAPASPQQQILHDWVTLQGIKDWATVNDLEDDAHSDAEQDLVKNALTQYSAHARTLEEAHDAMGARPVNRRLLATDQLSLYKQDPMEMLSVWAPLNSYSSESLIDLYLAGVLKEKRYDRRLGTSIYKENPDLLTLPPINDLYAARTKAHTERYKAAIATMLRLAMSRLPNDDRIALERGKIGLYYVRKNLSRTLDGGADLRENQIAGFGVVVLCRHDSQIRCVEVFPHQGLCRANPALAQAYVKGYVLDESGGWFSKGPNGNNDDFKALTHMRVADFDTRAYFAGGSPDGPPVYDVTNMGMERFAELDYNDGPQPFSFSPMSSFRSARFEQISRLIAEHRSPLTYEHFYAIAYDKTGIEERNEAISNTFDTILNTVIPFKGCIEDLASGDPDRRSGALFSCIMDVTAVVTVFAGGAGLFTKALASSSRLLNLSKVAARSLLSLFNPLDGVPQLIHGGAKLVGQTALKLNHLGKAMTRTGADQLRLFTGGSGAYDLIKALDKTGSAAQIRMTLGTVAHGRALFRDETLETAGHVLKRLGDKALPPDGIPLSELDHLFEKALIEASAKLQPAQALKALIGKQPLQELLGGIKSTYFKHYETARKTTNVVESMEALVTIDVKNINALNEHHRTLLTSEGLSDAKYHQVYEEGRFNPTGLTDDADRATAWILNASSSKGNEFATLKALLLEYSGNGLALSDPAVVRELHKRLVPTVPALRTPKPETGYPSSISGSIMLDRHLPRLDAGHEHFGKQLYGAVTGFHAFTDGNGRTARALYAIHELRANRFSPLAPASEGALSGLA
ncbi:MULTISPECIES: hypothetical protein [unclassified Pseudomonas]|uniref:hypothetical protein n=1 Tax=unclassified Pseudomonas TaxID=196821 RepID=UPI00111C4733|nr:MULTISPECIES: hypothetical protein [unclassified Pseudomonas]